MWSRATRRTAVETIPDAVPPLHLHNEEAYASDHTLPATSNPAPPLSMQMLGKGAASLRAGIVEFGHQVGAIVFGRERSPGRVASGHG